MVGKIKSSLSFLGLLLYILYDRIVGPVKGYDKELQEAFNPERETLISLSFSFSTSSSPLSNRGIAKLPLGT